MASEQSLYKRLYRLRQKQKRLQRRISLMETQLAGKKHYFGSVSRNRKKR